MNRCSCFLSRAILATEGLIQVLRGTKFWPKSKNQTWAIIAFNGGNTNINLTILDTTLQRTPISLRVCWNSSMTQPLKRGSLRRHLDFIFSLFYWLHSEGCRSYRLFKYIPFTHYQSVPNSYNVYNFIIRSNRNLSRVFPTRVSPALRYPKKSLDILLGYGLPRTRFTTYVVLECVLFCTYNPD